MEKEKLIEYVREYPFLYDNKDKNYTNLEKKDQAWNVIAGKLNNTPKECKKTWTLLRDYHRCCVKKFRDLANESEDGNVSIKKWKYSDEMSFLLPHIRTEHLRQTFKETGYESQDENISDFGDSLHFTEEPSSAHLDTTASEPICETFTYKRRRENPEDVAESIDDPSTNIMKYIREDKKSIDEIDYFFNGVSATVKSFPAEYKIKAKAKVFEVITKMELEVLEMRTKQANCIEAVIKSEHFTA